MSHDCCFQKSEGIENSASTLVEETVSDTTYSECELWDAYQENIGRYQSLYTGCLSELDEILLDLY